MKIFWSWQSDRDEKTNKYFVRDALKLAVKKLKRSAVDILEPVERERLDSLHVDSDTQGVKGHPPVKKTIFEKIDVASVFVADVTPITDVEIERDGGKKERKGVMNNNVALELGYAMKAMGDQGFLMVMNEHHCDPDSSNLPFDLQHLRWPIKFKLAPDADKDAIKAERDKLAKTFETALRPYVTEQASPTQAAFVPVEPDPSTGLFFQNSTALATGGRVRGGEVPCFFIPRRYLSLRLLPKSALKEALRSKDLAASLEESRLPLLGRSIELPIIQINHLGAIEFEYDYDTSSSNDLGAIFQVLKNGEVWSVTKVMHASSTTYGKCVYFESWINKAINAVPYYTEFMEQRLGVKTPLDIEFRAVDLRSRYLHWPSLHCKDFLTDVVEWSGELQSGKTEDVIGVCRAIAEEVLAAAGMDLPDDAIIDRE